MADYIDREKVMAEINRMGGHNLCEWDTIGVKALIDRQTTEDVVPRSEVEKAKQEVARELLREVRDAWANSWTESEFLEMLKELEKKYIGEQQ